MIYLLPFLNAFLLYISLEEKQILTKYYVWFLFNWKPKFIPAAVVGGCILCTAFWMGFFEVIIYQVCIDLSIFDNILLIAYNAVATAIIYRLLK